MHIRQVDDGMAIPFSSKASEARKAKILRYRTQREKRFRSSQFPPTLKVVLLAQRTLGVVRPFALRSHLILLNPLFLSLKQELFGDTFAPPRSPPSSLRVAGARVHVLEPQRDLRRLDRARSFPPTPTNRRA